MKGAYEASDASAGQLVVLREGMTRESFDTIRMQYGQVYIHARTA